MTTAGTGMSPVDQADHHGEIVAGYNCSQQILGVGALTVCCLPFLDTSVAWVGCFYSPPGLAVG